MNPQKLISENTQSLQQLQRGFLDYELFRTILANAVIPTVDFIIRRPDGSYLLITRLGSLWPNVKWFFGGRQNRGETTHNCLLRLAKREVGLEMDNVLNIKFSHLHDLFNPTSPNLQGQSLPETHTLMHLYVVDVKQDFIPKLDATSKDPVWYAAGTSPDDLPDVARYDLIQAGIIIQ